MTNNDRRLVRTVFENSSSGTHTLHVNIIQLYAQYCPNIRS